LAKWPNAKRSREQLYFPHQNPTPTTKMPASRQARSTTRHGKPYGLNQSQLDLLQETKSLKATAAKLTERCFKLRASKIRLRARCLRRAGATDDRIEELERQLKRAQDRNHLLAKAWNEVKRMEGLPHRVFRTKFNYAPGEDLTELTGALEAQVPNLVLHRVNPLDTKNCYCLDKTVTQIFVSPFRLPPQTIN
jgi:predicted RNase H-like nuclease (RuvC/YqgF family)